MSKKGKTLPASTREIVHNIIQFCQHEKMMNDVIIDLHKATDRVAAMTGLSRQTISKIKKEGATNNGVWVTPGTHRTGRPKKLILDDNNKRLIRDKIRQFYTVRNEIPTLRKLHRALREDTVINFSGGITTLRGILKEMGYKYEKGQSNKKILIEQPEPVPKTNKKDQVKVKPAPPPKEMMQPNNLPPKEMIQPNNLPPKEMIQHHNLNENKGPAIYWDIQGYASGQCWQGIQQPGLSGS